PYAIMTIIVFLMDNSASMNQRTYLGTTLLDVARGAVETLMKLRAREASSRWDRYMLVTLDDPPANIKAGWTENQAPFTQQLKLLRAHGVTTLGAGLKRTLDLLNLNRLQHGIDNYGCGRFPFYIEPAVIIALTDGRKLTSEAGITAELKPAYGTVPLGSAASGAAGQQQYVPPAGDSPIDIMCEVTGGRSYKLVNQRMLNQCLESLCQKCQPGIVVHLEKLGPDPPPATDDKGRPVASSIAGTAWQSCKRMLYVKVSTQRGNATGHWPIPEAYWPDLSAYRLPPRSAHPLVRFVCQKAEPQAIDGFPFDKYELEPSPLTQYILERREPHSAWQCHVPHSAKSSAPEAQKPFGYLKPASNLQSVNLIVLPYDYPTLFALLDELIKLHKMKPTDQWRARFAEYLRRMPSYYGQPLARGYGEIGREGCGAGSGELECWLINTLLNVSHAVPVSPAVQSYLKKVRVAAKAEYDRVVVATAASNQQHPEEGRQPVSVMGNYTEYLKRQPPPLRELDSSPLRLHTFGNPFKLAKQMKQVGFQAVDEGRRASAAG
uniref:VWFA domain-containing protein n=1 Tax=Macrostomum lignano TaxID=282301 RepID=A0A1I8IIJ7_9PLAT